MTAEIFLILLAAGFAGIFTWAFRMLPRERWQIIAAMPLSKAEGDEWNGLNLTYYGFFQASSNALAVAMAFILLGSIGVSVKAVFLLIVALFMISWPAAKIVARVVEKKAHTFTVGGAVFCGSMLAPLVIIVLNRFEGPAAGGAIPLIPALAAASIAYAYGEGLGRLACISFGCCYGKSLEDLAPWARRLFNRLHFRFDGPTKKVAYEGRLEGAPVVPIQAITSVVFVLIALGSTFLFLKMEFGAALLASVATTQAWRFISELFRADFRGDVKSVSAYQVMAILMVAGCVAFVVLHPEERVQGLSVSAGLMSLWSPSVLLFCQALWLGVFLITGRSMVTGSKLSFFVNRGRT